MQATDPGEADDVGCRVGTLLDQPPARRVLADLARQGRAAGAFAAPAQPVPVDPEAGAVPARDGIRLDDGEALRPTAPESAQQDPEEPVGGPEDRAPPRDQRGESLAEGQVLDHEVASKTQATG
jgi:hypothetical protein